MKLTPWYPGHIKPARPGVYETDPRTDPERNYQHWDGKVWGFAMHSTAGAASCAGIKSSCQNDKWRGLAEPPKENRK